MAEITFLMDKDPGGSGYFTEAEGYFDARGGVIDKPSGTEATTLDDVFKSLRVRAKEGEVFDVINLVAHGTGFSAVQFPISEARRADDGGITTLDQLKSAVSKAGSSGYPAVLGPPAVTASTKVCLYGCDVGRDMLFMSLLGQLFGADVTVYAPLRMSVFRHTGTTFEHRLARSWSTAYTKDVTKATNWAAERTAIGGLLKARFAAASSDIDAAIATATATLGPTYFFSGRMTIAGDPTGIELTSAVLGAGTVDDTTVPLKLTSSDFKPSGGGTHTAWVATLGKVLEESVSLENPSHYRKTVVSAARKAATTLLEPAREPVPVPDIPEPEPDPAEDDMANYGKHRGVVVDDQGGGRLKVRVPSVLTDDVVAEACLPPVPKSLLVWPKIGDEVWVEFEGGDVTHPIWTGALVAVDDPMSLTLQTMGDLTLRTNGTLTLEGLGTVRVQGGHTELETPSVHTNANVMVGILTAAAVVSGSYTPGAGNVM